MALKAVHVSDVPKLLPGDQHSSSYTCCLPPTGGGGGGGGMKKKGGLMVVGHRGHGMNTLHSTDRRMKSFKENSILSFNSAASHPGLDFIEFDVQVTKDDFPVIFHDDFILSEENGTIFERRITELSLEEFQSYGPQKGGGACGKSMVRKSDGKFLSWNVEADDHLCTLQEAFEQVKPWLGFNVEMKFDDHIVYMSDYLTHVIQLVLKVVCEYGKGRPIIFSTFQPDAALLLKKLQSTYPVFFLTNGGNETYYDVRRNSLDEAIKLCLEGGLDGIVSEVKGIFRNPEAISKMKSSNLSLLTYGKLNNVPEVVYVQYLMGIDGVIVDFVEEITRAVAEMIKRPIEEGGDGEKQQQQLIELMKV